ncbi:MAG: hypothetical protein JSV16_14850 [Candidatus Hydrogenedentota bacterium]|nr:MAG: hypothetical protein JSV16_14850 [Candidatus Hydrogenedentota bacterium]
MTVEQSLYNQDSGLLKHSGLGIASFIISLAAGTYEFVLVVVAGVLESITPGGMDEESLVAILLGLFVLGGLAANLAGMALGIAGLVQNDRKKVYPTLGFVFNGAIILGLIALMAIGASMP